MHVCREQGSERGDNEVGVGNGLGCMKKLRVEVRFIMEQCTLSISILM